jgi:hypothetical protein
MSRKWELSKMNQKLSHLAKKQYVLIVGILRQLMQFLNIQQPSHQPIVDLLENE